MNKSLWLKGSQVGNRRLHSGSRLFGGLIELEMSVKADLEVEVVASTGVNEQLYNTTEASHQEPVLLLQEHATDAYCLKREFINTGLLYLRQLSQAEKIEHWQAAKLRTDPLLQDERLYVVQCMDYDLLCWRRVNAALEPLSRAYTVQRDVNGMIVHDGVELSEPSLRTLEVTAARALYALWTDIGSVLIAVSGTGSMAVRSAWSIEHEELPYDYDVLGVAIEQWLERWEADDGQLFQLGADPELLLTDQHGNLISALSILSDVITEEIGIDAILYKQKRMYPIVELRPYPVQEPSRLMASMRRLLKQLHDLTDDQPLCMLAGAMPVKGVALGGHLHISGVPCTPRLMRLLDVMLALPFAALEDERGKGRHRKYGGLGDFRKQFHGGFEYRALPSWLVSPALAQAAIYTCWLTISERAILASNLQDVMPASEIYNNGGKEELYTSAQTYIELLCTVASQKEISQKLRPLQQALLKRTTWDESQDIRSRWQLI